MDSSASGTPLCPTCGEQVTAEHACLEVTSPAATSEPSSFEDTGRIAIPEALRNTGLFRTAWQPSPAQAAPETVSNFFARIEEATTVSDQETPEVTETPVSDAAPEAPVDPWAGLDTKITPVREEVPADPWAHLSTPVADAPVAHVPDADPFADLTPASAAPAPVTEAFPEPAPVAADPQPLVEEPEFTTPEHDFEFSEEYANEHAAPEQVDPALFAAATPLAAVPAEDESGAWSEGSETELEGFEETPAAYDLYDASQDTGQTSAVLADPYAPEGDADDYAAVEDTSTGAFPAVAAGAAVAAAAGHDLYAPTPDAELAELAEPAPEVDDSPDSPDSPADVADAEDDFWWEGESPELTATDLEPITEPINDGADLGFADRLAAARLDAAPAAFDESEPASEPASEVDEIEPVPEHLPEEAPAPFEDAVPGLSAIAAAEAAAVAAGHPAPSAEPTVLPAMDETAAIDLDAAFAAEAAAASQAHLEQVPEPEQSAWDLYGDTLYAPEPGDADFPEPPTEIAAAAPHEADATFVPGLTGLGRQSASLPTSVPFAPGIGVDGKSTDPDEVVPVEAPAEERRSRKGLVAAAVALVLVAGGGGWFWWNGQKDAPVKDAFASSHESFTKASTQLTQAATISEIAAAGQAYATNVPQLESTEAKTRESDSDVSLAARRAVVAEKAVAEAAAPLANLSAADLSTWGTAKEALTTSLSGLADVKSDIETAGAETGRLPDAAVVDHLQDVISTEVVDGAGKTVTDLSAKLEAASLLADVRAVGTSANEYVTPLKEAASGLDDEEQKSELNAVVEFHQALSGFSKIRPSTFDDWAAMKKEASEAAKDLTSGEDEARAGIDAADALVTKARETFENWETKHAAAKSKKAADLAGLDAAEKAVEAADTTFTKLTEELSSLLSAVRSMPAEGKEGDAYMRLDAAATAREDVLSSLKGFTLTPRPAGLLEPLVEVVEADAAALRAAAEAAGRCEEDCKLTDTAGWKGLAAGTRNSGADWSAGVTPFLDSVEAAREKVKARELPKRPKI